MKDRNIYFNTLGVYQIIGGLIGIGVVVWVMFSYIYPNNMPDKRFAIFSAVLFALFYCYSILCGILLIKKHNWALNLSSLNQLLQILSFSIYGYAYKYQSGIFASIKIDFVNNIYSFEWGLSSWELYINSGSTFGLVSINFFALLVVILIEELKKRSNSCSRE